MRRARGAVQGDRGRAAGRERHLTHPTAAAQRQTVGRVLTRIDAGAVELGRVGAAHVHRQGKGQVVQRAAPVQIQLANDPALTRQTDIAAADVQNGAVRSAAVGQPHPSVGFARGQEGPGARREGQVRAGGNAVGQGDGAPGRHAAGVHVQIAQSDALAAQEEVARRARRTIVRAADHRNPTVRRIRALAEAQRQIGVVQRQSAGRDLLEAGGQIDARLGQCAGQGAASVHVAADLDRPGRERATRVPVQRQPQLTSCFDNALGPRATGRAGQFTALDLDASAVQLAGQLQARRLAEQAVQFVQTHSQIAAPSVEVQHPRRAGPRRRGPDRTAEGAARVGQHAPGVGQLRLAAEVHPAQQIARARAVQRQALALQIDLGQQDGTILHPRRLHLHPRGRTQEAADDAFARSAVRANVAVQIDAAVLDRDVQRSGDARGAIAGDIGVQQGDLAIERPGLGVALEQAGIGRWARHIGPDQPAQRGRLNIQTDSVGRTAVGVADQAARLGLDVVGKQLPRHALAGLVRRRDHGEAEPRSAADLGDEGRQQVRVAEVGEARDARALVAEMALDDQGDELSRLNPRIDDIRVQNRDRRERLIRRIAQGPRQRSALSLIGAQVEARVFQLAAEGRRQTQEVARPVQAVGVDRRALGAGAWQAGVPRQAPTAVFLGETFHQFDVGRELVDADRDRLRAGRFASGRLDHGPTQDANGLGLDVVRMEAAAQQGQIRPVHAEVLRLQPDALTVGQCDAVDGEVAE